MAKKEEKTEAPAAEEKKAKKAAGTEEAAEAPNEEKAEKKPARAPEKQVFEEKEEMLAIPTKLTGAEDYLKAGTHIGTKNKTGSMRQYIYKTRKDGLKILNIGLIDERLIQVGKLLAAYPESKIALISRKLYAQTPIRKFAELTGVHAVTGRFIPGTLTNPQMRRFIEPEIVLITDPDQDRQAVKEAIKTRAMIILLASTNNEIKNADLVVPINNKGRKSLALTYWLLAKEYFKEKGNDDAVKDLANKLKDFEFKLKENKEEDLAARRDHDDRPSRDDRHSRDDQ